MRHPERVQDFLEHIISAIERAIRYVGNQPNLQALEGDEQAQDAIIRTIAVVGEAATHIRKTDPDYELRHPEIPWQQMRAIRNKVVHDYFDVSWDIVWDTVKNDFPTLLDQISALLHDYQSPTLPSR